jgi:nucleoside-diphosphate-sugar epimerase
MAKYLVTGGAGFIGSNIVEELVRLKGSVPQGLSKKLMGTDPKVDVIRVLDNFSAGTKENLAPFMNMIELVEGDIRDKNMVPKVMKGMDFVIHQAALRSVAKSVDDPVETHDVNATGTLNLLIAAKEAGVRRFVYASTCAAYGDAKKFPQKESDEVAPISPYGASKLAGETYCRVFAKTLGLETVALRYFNVYGPRQNPESKYSSVVPGFIFDIMKKKIPVIDWDGKQSRDFVFVKDVVQANILAINARSVSGGIFNIGNGRATTIYEILMQIENILGKNIPPKFGPKREGDVRKVYSDISRARRMMGFKPAFTLEKGLKLTIDWFSSSLRGGRRPTKQSQIH